MNLVYPITKQINNSEMWWAIIRKNELLSKQDERTDKMKRWSTVSLDPQNIQSMQQLQRLLARLSLVNNTFL
jgi:septin family protein